MKFQWFLFPIFLAFSSLAMAKGGEISGGGNLVAAKFVQLAKELGNDLRQHYGETPSWFDIDAYDRAVNGDKNGEGLVAVIPVKTLVIPKGLEEEQGLFLHAFFTADNIRVFPGPIGEAMKDPLQNSAVSHLILHEFLGAIGLEKHGQYSRSAELIEILKEPISKKLGSWRIDLPRFDMIEKFGKMNVDPKQVVLTEAIERGADYVRRNFPQGALVSSFGFGQSEVLEWRRNQKRQSVTIRLKPSATVEVTPEMHGADYWANWAASLNIEFEIVQDEVGEKFSQILVRESDFVSPTESDFMRRVAVTRLMVELIRQNAKGPQAIAKLMGGMNRRAEEFIAEVLEQFSGQSEAQQKVHAQIGIQPRDFLPLVIPMDL